MLNIIWGSNKEKPEAAKALADILGTHPFYKDSYLYIGYPVIGSPLGPVRFDALLISQEHGLVAFDLVEALDLNDFSARLDEIASMLEVKLKPYPHLKNGRDLRFDINTITFAPAKKTIPNSEPPNICVNRDNLLSEIQKFPPIGDDALFSHLLAAVQVVTTIRSGKRKREPQNALSRAARLKRVEDSIANLDQHQSRAVIETVEGIQRIRGLAGSGKTIILALKVAYLHSQNPEWNIAVTFNTRSLKEQFKRLINSFTIEQTGNEPDWERIDIINAWGAPGDREQDGIYHKFCRAHGLVFHDFVSAKRKTGSGDAAFAFVCSEALKYAGAISAIYDIVLVDEAQDFPPEFLRLCFRLLADPKRLVYAYDELQSLTGNSVLPPEELFGKDSQGRPLVDFDPSDSAIPRQDIILEKCYRNSRSILATAHALGFGLYREGGLVQFFDQDSLWKEVGYVVVDGKLEPGECVTLSRTDETSPSFLQDHSEPEDLIKFIEFSDSISQAEWLVERIKEDIYQEELRPEDIVVINTDPVSTQDAVGLARQLLYSVGINSELAGVSTSRDIFSKEGAVTFTGIFRAKGNEAGMVYIINAQDCYSAITKSHLALVRNRLFTALTRSKAWVRVLGIGPKMGSLTAEWERLKENDYKLTFKFPTAEEKKQLRLISVDQTPRRLARERRFQKQQEDLLNAAKSGELDVSALIEELIAVSKLGKIK